MKKINGNPIRKTARLAAKKTGSNKWAPARHPMTKLEKQAPPKVLISRARKGTARSPKAH